MKNILWLSLVALTMCLVSCDDSDNNGAGTSASHTIESTISGSSSFIFQGYESVKVGFNVLIPSEKVDKPIYIRDKKFTGESYSFILAGESSLGDMSIIPDENTGVHTVDIKDGDCYWCILNNGVEYLAVKMRVAYVSGNEVGVEYIVAKYEQYSANKNANSASAHPEAARLEMPALNADNFFLSHYVTLNSEKVVNYSIEWNNEKKHAQWVAFEFNKENCAKNVQRSKDFVADPDLPESMRVDNSYHTSDGFDRGHLCASDDRVYSAEANAQTFYFSNMSPQFNEFNAGFWQALEAEVQTWGRLTASGTYDKVYVAKGGTLDKLLVNYVGSNKGQDGVIPKTDAAGLTVKGLPCPAYYFMAVLAQKGDTYQAIGFIAPHSQTLTPIAGGENFTVADLKKYAVSVDELESQTGIDFFCNLPDSIEDSVESKLSPDSWKW